MSVARQLFLSLIILAVAAGGWIAFERPASIFGDSEAGDVAGAAAPATNGRGTGRDAPPVMAESVEIDTAGTEIRAIGTAAAAREVVVFPQVTGIVTEVSFTPGSSVERGQPLVKLEDADQQVAVELATLEQETAQQTLQRAERLSESGNITAVTLIDAQTAARKAAIDLRSAEIELAKRTITAPFDGEIGLADIAVGDLVNSSKAIATIADMSSVTVTFTVPERVVGQVEIGQDVVATAAAAAGVTIIGELSAIDNRVDEVTRTLRVEATLPNDTADLRSGMAISIALSIPGTPRPMVPSLAIQWDRQGSFVWKLDGDVVRRTPVQIISRHSGMVTVASELAEGDDVVTEGVLRLRDGHAVSRVDEEAVSPEPDEGIGPAAGAGSAAAAERRG